jgi:hypothetical protein
MGTEIFPATPYFSRRRPAQREKRKKKLSKKRKSKLTTRTIFLPSKMEYPKLLTGSRMISPGYGQEADSIPRCWRI